jgi:quinol-cytochrome oxidoreductase complex cytochrome b subunit
MKIIDRVWNWLDTRGHISDIPLKGMPDYSLNISYWIGALVAAAFFYLAITGMLLLMYYTPYYYVSSNGAVNNLAWISSNNILTKVAFGNLLLTSHQYMAYAMIFLMFVHFFRNYYLGDYKKPRELTWIVGVLMSVITILMGFTGYFLPYTEISKDATDVGIGMAGIIPYIGNTLSSILSGNGTISSELSRFLAFHVLILPAILLLLFGLHFYLYEKNEAAPPLSSELKGEKAEHKKIAWFPVFLAYSLGTALLLYGTVLIWSALEPLTLPPPVGSGISIVPMPEWYLAAFFKIVDFQYISTNIVYILLVIILFLILVPFLDRSPSRHPGDRPLFIAVVTTFMQYMILFTVWAYLQPGVPVPATIWVPISVGIGAYDILIVYVLHHRYQKKSAIKAAGGT